MTSHQPSVSINHQPLIEKGSGESETLLLTVSESRKLKAIPNDNRQLKTENYLAHRNIPITIVGGGIHGVSIALRLLREIPTAANRLVILDRYPLPLTQWKHKTERQGMTFLRSPAVHHITPDALGVVEYAEHHNREDELAPPYSQPSTQLFRDFCTTILTELAAYKVYHQFEVEKLRWDKSAGRFPFRLISTNNTGFRSSCVVLAIGADDCAYVPPEFAQWQRKYPKMVLHASQFTVDSNKDGQHTGGKIVIVGGGLTAGTLAKSLSEQGHHVVLIARKELKMEQFDFPPIWLGPKALTEFANETNFRRRYDIIQQNRGEGSITPNIMETLVSASNIDLYPKTCIHNIVSTEESPSAQRLQIETTRTTITNVSRVILATGYQFDLRRYGFLAELITKYQIPIVRGLPCLDDDLQLQPVQDLFGSGTIAQLQIGPAAGNIAGANLAYERMREKLHSHLGSNP